MKNWKKEPLFVLLVVHILGGNQMDTDTLQQYFKKIELPLSINVGVVGGVLFLHALSFITVPPSTLKWLLGYASLNLISAPFALKERFITPNIVARKCNFCGSYLRSVKLVCPKCESISEETP